MQAHTFTTRNSNTKCISLKGGRAASFFFGNPEVLMAMNSQQEFLGDLEKYSSAEAAWISWFNTVSLAKDAVLATLFDSDAFCSILCLECSWLCMIDLCTTIKAILFSEVLTEWSGCCPALLAQEPCCFFKEYFLFLSSTWTFKLNSRQKSHSNFFQVFLGLHVGTSLYPPGNTTTYICIIVDTEIAEWKEQKKMLI